MSDRRKRVRGEVTDCNVLVDDGVTVTGRVTRTEDGRPVAGAHVAEAAYIRLPPAVGDPPPVTTDADGRFTLPGVERGPDALCRLSVTAQGRASGLFSIDVDGGPVEIAGRLAPAGTLRGIVTRPDARRRSRVPIWIREASGERRTPARETSRYVTFPFNELAESDLDGHWSAANLPLGVPLVVEAATAGGRRALVVIDPQTRAAEVELSVFGQKRFDLLVLGPDGEPLKGAEVTAAGTRLRARTGRTGRATVWAGRRDVKELTASHPAGWPTSADLRCDRAPRDLVEMRLRRRAVATGRVVVSDGERAEVCELLVSQRDPDGRIIATSGTHVTTRRPSFRIELCEGPAELHVTCSDGRRASLAFTAPATDLVVRLPGLPASRA